MSVIAHGIATTSSNDYIVVLSDSGPGVDRVIYSFDRLRHHNSGSKKMLVCAIFGVQLNWLPLFWQSSSRYQLDYWTGLLLGFLFSMAAFLSSTMDTSATGGSHIYPSLPSTFSHPQHRCEGFSAEYLFLSDIFRPPPDDACRRTNQHIFFNVGLSADGMPQEFV